MELLHQAYRAFTAAQLPESKVLLEKIVNLIPLVVVSTKSDNDDLKEILGICKEYLLSIRIKSQMDEVGANDVKRSLELAAYFTHCNLQPSHLLLTLKTAMANAFKNKVRHVLVCPCIVNNFWAIL
jgi:coatomer protein complex subunit alpha (xenin)